jgi:hypothetical protein
MAALVAGVSVTTARAQSGFEADPVLEAKDVVGPELLKGGHFIVATPCP